MLVRVTLDEKQKDGLTPKAKQNSTLAKYTDDPGDLKFFTNADGSKTYLRVWETVPLAEGKTGSPKYVISMFEVQPMLGTAATPAVDIK